MSKPQAPTEVNQQHHPAADHPFRRAFSPRRIAQDGFDKRTPPKKLQGCEHVPSALVSERPASNAQAAKIPWHLRPLPADWSEEEVRFFSNWMRELTRLHEALMSTAAERIKLLRRARHIYFKLAWRVDERVREVRTAKPNGVEAVRQ